MLPCTGSRRGAPLSEVQITSVRSSSPSRRRVPRISPIDQSSSSTASPHGPFFDLPRKAELANAAVVLPGMACGM